MDVSVNHFAASNGALEILGTDKLSGASVTESSALRRTLHDHALLNTSAADLVVIVSVKENDKFSPLFFPYPFRCGGKCEIQLRFGKMRPFGYYARDNWAMISQSLVLTSGRELPHLQIW